MSDDSVFLLSCLLVCLFLRVSFFVAFAPAFAVCVSNVLFWLIVVAGLFDQPSRENETHETSERAGERVSEWEQM